MAATINQRHMNVMGPFKMEVVRMSATGADTFQTDLVNPLFAFAFQDRSVSFGNSSVRVDISGRTCTFGAGLPASTSVTALVFGF